MYPKMQLCACGAQSDDNTSTCLNCGESLSISTDNSQAYAAGAVFGSYRLVRQIGSGGMGRVFIAEHIRLGRPVALKILRAEFSGNIEAVQRFFAEARAVNTINHENIIEVSDFIENPSGSSFYVMELLKGVDLRTLQQREGMLTLPRAVNIGIQVCRGLGAAHDAGIVHRDLKPDNIFLVERDGRKDFVKLLDFGVAKLMNAKLDGPSSFTTSAGIAVGTPEYMSPEQTLGEPVNHLADVYSTGIILFEMISGQRPFHANSAREVMVKHMTAHPPRVSKVRDYPYEIPPPLDQLIAHCLKKEPQDRPLNIKEVEQRLQKIALRLQQESALPPTLTVPFHRGKHVWLAAAAATVLLVAVGLLARRPRPPAPPPLGASGQQKTQVTPSGAVARQRVRVTFESVPPGATVFRDRATQPVGVTPFFATLDASSRPEAFEFRLEGRQVARQDVVLAKDAVIRVTLLPMQVESGAGPSDAALSPRRKSKKAEAADEAKTKPPALDHGAVLDPFE
ncbi:MAG: serine/threonine protein kinase [Deltaproteobacteria bacterium]|nr:serine/threonine protein kinase [Deltaproteobacteria bacterium]